MNNQVTNLISKGFLANNSTTLSTKGYIVTITVEEIVDEIKQISGRNVEQLTIPSVFKKKKKKKIKITVTINGKQYVEIKEINNKSNIKANDIEVILGKVPKIMIKEVKLKQ